MSRSSWAIGDGLLGWVRSNVAFRCPAIELGSGEGSPLLGAHLSMVSVEHDPHWASVAASNRVPCVLAPIRDGWYDMVTVESLVRAVRPMVVIVDGPPASIGRAGFAELFPHLLAYSPHACVVFDDTHRGPEAALANTCRLAYPGSCLMSFPDGEKRFSVLVHPLSVPTDDRYGALFADPRADGVLDILVQHQALTRSTNERAFLRAGWEEGGDQL